MLIIFDIDGTLCDTHDVDSACFANALEAVTGHPLATVDWSRYPEATGSAIVRDFLRVLGDTNPVETEGRILSEFLSRLESAARSDPASFRAIDGALEMFHELADDPAHTVAIATGCWTQSARFKLQAAGFRAEETPFASSSDVPRRRDIISLAAERAGCDLTDAVYVGDGLWDLQATQALGIPLIGIGRKHTLLRERGARHTFPSFQDRAAFFKALADASPARPT